MNDSQIIDWIQGHLTSLIEDGHEDGAFKIEYLDDDGCEQKARGKTLRKAVENASQEVEE